MHVKFLKRLFSVILTIAMFSTKLPSQDISATASNFMVPREGICAEEDFTAENNGFVKYYVNNYTGGFSVMPASVWFDPGKAQSFAEFVIDGNIRRFGYGADGQPGNVVPPYKNAEGTVQTSWFIDGFVITQYINIIATKAEDGARAAAQAQQRERAAAQARRRERAAARMRFTSGTRQSAAASR